MSIKDKFSRIDKIADAYANKASGVQQELFREVSRLISKIERSGDQIKASANNLKLINQINDRIRSIITSGNFPKVVQSVLSEFDEQARINIGIAKKEIGDVKGQDFVKQYLTASKQLAAQSLLDVSNTSLSKDVSTYLTEAISNGQSYSKTFDFIESYFKGAPGEEGSLVKYTKQIVNDSFAASDRSVNETIAKQNGIEFFKYLGGEVQDTRCFCDLRNGKIFHRKEIEAWGNGQISDGVPGGSECDFPWKGMNKTTTSATIFTYLGGYNCRHSLIIVSDINVPVEVFQRVIAKGYYNPSNEIKKIKGL